MSGKKLQDKFYTNSKLISVILTWTKAGKKTKDKFYLSYRFMGETFAFIQVAQKSNRLNVSQL